MRHEHGCTHKVTRILCAAVLTMAAAAPAAAQEFKLGVVTFLSGGAAGPFGVPAKNAAETYGRRDQRRHAARAVQHQGHRRLPIKWS